MGFGMKTLVKSLAGIVIGGAIVATAGLLLFAAYVFRVDATAARPLVQASDGIVILTGRDDRLREGLKLFEHEAGRRVLISGVGQFTTRAEMSRLFPMPTVLADCCLDLGYAARNTVGNALETRDWAETWGFRRLILVTSDVHIPRSLVEIKRVLPDVEIVTYPIRSRSPDAEPWWRRSQTRNAVAKEYIKFLTAVVRYTATVSAGLLPSEPPLSASRTSPPQDRHISR